MSPVAALALINSNGPVAVRMTRIADKVENGELPGDANSIIRASLAILKETEVQLKIATFLSKHGKVLDPKPVPVAVGPAARIKELETELAELKKAA